jgi:hypothetical protein
MNLMERLVQLSGRVVSWLFMIPCSARYLFYNSRIAFCLVLFLFTTFFFPVPPLPMFHSLLVKANMGIFHMQLDVTSSQLLVTDNVFKNEGFRKQLSDTVNSLLNLRVIPVFNENDAVSTRKAPYQVCHYFAFEISLFGITREYLVVVKFIALFFDCFC